MTEGLDGFGIDHLPYGSGDVGDGPFLCTRVGDTVIDLAGLAADGHLPHVCRHHDVMPLMAAGSGTWAAVRTTLQDLLESDSPHLAPHRHPGGSVELLLPFEVADYVDFYASEQHVRNVSTIFRPDEDPLPDAWRHLPIGYHGRSGSVVVSGTPVTRPSGHRRENGEVVFAPTGRLDVEVELGAVVGVPSRGGRPIPIERAAAHLFGVTMLNDWSARDIQRFEYRPLGPFLGKSFSTSISPWITPMAALSHAHTTPPTQDPRPLAHLRANVDSGLDISVTLSLRSEKMRGERMPYQQLSTTTTSHLYWTLPQQLAHLTSNGAPVRTGDLFATGTISGPESTEFGSLLELTWNGDHPITLPTGERRTFLEDGDSALITAHAGPVTLGSVEGTVERRT